MYFVTGTAVQRTCCDIGIYLHRMRGAVSRCDSDKEIRKRKRLPSQIGSLRKNEVRTKFDMDDLDVL